MPFLDDSGVTKLVSYLKTKIEAALEGKFSKVTVSRVLTEGTHAATITVDGTDYEVYAPTPPYAHTSNPRMNNHQASPGSSRYYSRGDHVHPTDTSRQARLVSGTNIKTINGQSLIDAGNLSFSDLSDSLSTSDKTEAWANLGISDLFGRNEPTSTALYTHTAGRTFVFGTQLVQCTADIAVGDTITIGTNVTETTVNTVINKLITHDILPKVTDDCIIPDNADLNNYWQPGVWEIPSGSNAETMTNVPTTQGGAKLITIAATYEGSYSSQFYLNTYGKLWCRYKRNTSDTPSAWKEITMQGEITASDLSAVQYTSQSLTSAQENQVLSNLGLTSDLKAATSVSVSNFFSTNPLSGATYDIRKSGKVVSFYAYFSSAPSSGTIKSGYRPCGGTSGHYMILPLYSKSSPYTPVGSVWINGSGAVSFYGASSGGYVAGSWVCT